MKALLVRLWRRQRQQRLIFLLLVLYGFPYLQAAEAGNSGPPPEPTFPVRENAKEEPHLSWNLLWTGSLRNSLKTHDGLFPAEEDIFSGAALFNRGELNLVSLKSGISFRFLAMDKRNLPFDKDNAAAGFSPGLGIYHNESGSRFLQGSQNEYGLPARIRNVWRRSVPFMESRSPSARDLKTDFPAASNESYLYLALPPDFLPGFGAFASAAFDEEMNPALGGGIGFGNTAAAFRLEGFYTEGELEARKAHGWFSYTPPLPERDFRIYGLAMIFNTPGAAFGADWAWSETFAWGRGMYGNFSLRVGNKPWRFSLAGDGAGSRFVDRDGGAAGSALRLAVKGEQFRPRSGLLRFQGIFRAPAPGEAFDRGSLSVYYRPSAPGAERRGLLSGERVFPFRVSRLSFGVNRDARNPEKAVDGMNALAGFRFGFLRGSLSGALRCLSRLDGEAGIPAFYRPPAFEVFESFKIAGELGLRPGIFDISGRLGYTARAEKGPLWEISLNTSVKPGKWGRLGLKIASTDFPEKWNYALSWRFHGRF